MAGTTTRYGFPFQEVTDPPNGAGLGEDLAEAVEASLATIEDKPFVVLDLGTDQNTPDDTPTLVSWSNEECDFGNLHSNVTNPSRVTVSVPGWYRINCTLIWEADANPEAGTYSATIKKNGAAVRPIGRREILSGAVAGTVVSVSGSVPLTTGQYIEIEAYQNSGYTKHLWAAASQYHTYFEMEYVRPLT